MSVEICRHGWNPRMRSVHIKDYLTELEGILESEGAYAMGWELKARLDEIGTLIAQLEKAKSHLQTLRKGIAPNQHGAPIPDAIEAFGRYRKSLAYLRDNHPSTPDMPWYELRLVPQQAAFKDARAETVADAVRPGLADTEIEDWEIQLLLGPAGSTGWNTKPAFTEYG